MKIYFASPLFTVMERTFNEAAVNTIEHFFDDKFDIYLPQRNDSINDKNHHATAMEIAKHDTKHLMDSDILICVLDGVTIDAGVACEIGKYTTKENGKIIAFYSDVRSIGSDNEEKIESLIDNSIHNPFFYVNQYVVGEIENYGGHFVNNIEELIYELRIIVD